MSNVAGERGHAGGKRRGHTDENQPDIVAALEAMGVVVGDLHGAGHGINDLLCITPAATFLIECKMPGEKLNANQKEWHTRCKYRNHVAYSVADAITIAGLYLAPSKSKA